ncbi:hypothetical protein AgCh_023800 [Apium graveolens]
MSRRVVNVKPIGFNQKGVKYDWKTKVGTYLPDRRSTVVSSIVFMSLGTETCVEATTGRAMAWFTVAVSSGVPLLFISIQTEQSITSGFIFFYGVTRGTAADRAGLRQLYEEARKPRHLVVISRLEGKSLMPTKASCVGLIHSCDNTDIKETLTSAMEDLDSIKLHVMYWPNNTSTNSLGRAGAVTVRPPT